MDEWEALKHAVTAARYSTCQKSQRGVVIWRRCAGPAGILSHGWNHPAVGRCDGSAACRRDCSKTCVHAEMYALTDAAQLGKGIRGAEMLHVKVVDGEPVPSGPPSCWQCSRHIAFSGLVAMWLLEEVDGEPRLVRYNPVEFHRLTLERCGLHPYGGSEEPPTGV